MTFESVPKAITIFLFFCFIASALYHLAYFSMIDLRFLGFYTIEDYVISGLAYLPALAVISSIGLLARIIQQGQKEAEEEELAARMAHFAETPAQQAPPPKLSKGRKIFMLYALLIVGFAFFFSMPMFFFAVVLLTYVFYYPHFFRGLCSYFKLNREASLHVLGTLLILSLAFGFLSAYDHLSRADTDGLEAEGAGYREVYLLRKLDDGLIYKEGRRFVFAGNDGMRFSTPFNPATANQTYACLAFNLCLKEKATEALIPGADLL